MNTRLDIIQQTRKTGFHEVCIEISGICNAKCKYCPSGSASKYGREFMTPDIFRKIVDRLLNYGIINRDNSQIDLFWWGEPFLNPHLKEIIGIINEKKIDYVLSTNGFYYQKLPKNLLKSIKRLIVSMPGFSQESYDKIHGFNFEKIKENIKKYANDMELAGVKDKMWVAYHMYQFNLDEIYDAYVFFKELGISFNPGYAFPLLVRERVAYAKNTLDEKRKNDMLKELVTCQLDKMIQSSDKKACIYQKRNFIVDEQGGVFGYLNIEHCEENYCGNILKDDIQQIFDNISKKEVCTECISCGVAPTDMSFKFFYNPWFQMMKQTEFLENLCMNKIDNAETELKIMKIIMLLRDAEQQEEKKYYYKKAKDIIDRNNIEISRIIEELKNWAMRPQSICDDFLKYIKQ